MDFQHESSLINKIKVSKKMFLISCTGKVGEDLPPDVKEVNKAFGDLSRLSVADHTEHCPGYMRGWILLK